MGVMEKTIKEIRKVGFSSGDFYRIFPKKEHAGLVENIDSWNKDGVNAIELNCSSEQAVDYFLNQEVDLSFLDYISVHGPNLFNLSDKKLKETLLDLEEINSKYEVDNIVFHIGSSVNWQLVKEIISAPVSVENMDNQKKRGKTVESVKRVIDKHDFNLTLDLQHCYTNDRSMNLANRFHEELGDKIIEYHLSGFDHELLHYPLFKTKQDKIIDALKKDAPVIIESTFDEVNEAQKELNYILNVLR